MRGEEKGAKAPNPRSISRHRPGYFTEYIRKYRAEVKAGIRVPKPRTKSEETE